MLGDEEGTRGSKERADVLMAEISRSRGRNLGEADVDGLLAFWSK